MASTINANTTTGLVNTADTSGQLQLQTANTTAVTIDSSQNVGIGTSSPTNFGSNFKLLEVKGSDFGVIQATSTSGTTTIEMMGASGTGYLGTRTNHPLVFRTNDTERMRIDSSGNLLVGTTSVINSAKFSVKGSSAYSGETTGSADFFWIQANTGGTTSQSVYVIPCRFGSTLSFKGGIYYNGSTGLMEYTGTSDYRTKQDVKDAKEQLSILNSVKVKEFLIKGSNTRVIGFIAHELAEHIPVAVTGEKDAVDENGEPILQTVNQQALIPVMVKAIQEQQALITQLQADVALLKGAA